VSSRVLWDQRVFEFTTVTAVELSLFERLSARFSFKDLPDFFDIACRGDLSDIVGPSIGGLRAVPVRVTVRLNR